MSETISKKNTILERASILFLKNGFVATSMRDIAAHVDLEVSSLYNHISSKEEILKSVCYDVAEIYISKIDLIMCGHQSFIEKLKSIINLHIDMAIDYPASLLVFNDEWKHMKADNRSIFIEWRKEYEKKLLILIQSGIDKKIIQPLDPDLIIHSILSTTKWAYKWMDENNTRTKESLKIDITKLFLNGLQK